MLRFICFLLFIVPYGAMAQSFMHEGNFDEAGHYIGKQHWYDSASELLVAEVIYDESGHLLSYKTWVDGDIMDAEELDPDRPVTKVPNGDIAAISPTS